MSYWLQTLSHFLLHFLDFILFVFLWMVAFVFLVLECHSIATFAKVLTLSFAAPNDERKPDLIIDFRFFFVANPMSWHTYRCRPPYCDSNISGDIIKVNFCRHFSSRRQINEWRWRRWRKWFNSQLRLMGASLVVVIVVFCRHFGLHGWRQIHFFVVFYQH